MMSSATSVSLGEHFAEFVEAQVSQGRYDSAGDVVHAALQLLEEQETKLAALHAALLRGEESGASGRDVRDIWKDVSAGRRGPEGE